MAIIIGFIMSLVGFAYLAYGKKTVDVLFIVFGLLLMIYPYFTQNLVTSVIIGMLLVIVPFVLKSVR
ncbi:hypothetical protein [Desulfosporosinus sp. OT]|uniref:hypothetical protein n=1 Tax=Desulfosporosinus sp. OT TaxID=913865 RepID=UPI000223ABEC|nr:hypothetical protein [Desulfosporosinus sp. OT]EGW40337.1 putative membrane protein [Desulfosporosinus sp. OT]